MQSELKPCPFCGESTYLSVDDIDGWIASVACGGCDMRGPMSEWKYADVEEAKADGLARWNAAWNTRTTPAAAVDREAIARVIDPLAWAAVGLGDTKDSARMRANSLAKADAIIALRPADQGEGWACVPRQPTDAMWRASTMQSRELCEVVWSAMLSAAPAIDSKGAAS